MPETQTMADAPPIKPPDTVAVASEAEEAPKKKAKAPSGKPKFTRDSGGFNADGSKLMDEFDDTYTQDKCPNGHDLNKIIGESNGHPLVNCEVCHAQFESKESL